MSRILLTAFEPYEPWTSNASWLAIVELTRSLQVEHDVTTRLYPVELSKMKQRLETDLKARYDFAIHLGQAPGSSCISLEKFAVNAVHDAPTCAAKEAAEPICSDAPTSFAVSLPIREMAAELRQTGIPARVSFGGGAYLCNATLYWSSHLVRLYDL